MHKADGWNVSWSACCVKMVERQLSGICRDRRQLLDDWSRAFAGIKSAWAVRINAESSSSSSSSARWKEMHAREQHLSLKVIVFNHDRVWSCLFINLNVKIWLMQLELSEAASDIPCLIQVKSFRIRCATVEWWTAGYRLDSLYHV